MITIGYKLFGTSLGKEKMFAMQTSINENELV